MLNEFASVLLDKSADDGAQTPPPLPPRQWEKMVAVGGIRPTMPASQSSADLAPKVRDATNFLRQWFEVQQRGLTGVVKGAYARSRMARLNLETKGLHDIPATFGLVGALAVSIPFGF
jgi:hypothetical protein